jgi:hypothetical protein
MFDSEGKYHWSRIAFGLTLLIVLSLNTSCGGAEVENLTNYESDTLVEYVEIKADVEDEGEAAPPDIPKEIIDKLLPCDGFDFPVGPPNAERYYKFRGFLPEGIEHLGEDWNGIGGGNTDFGDFVYAAADGVVFYSGHYNNGWGTVIRILHNYGTAEAPRYCETLYAHVASSWVKPGLRMKRGDIIGTIGSAEGKYHAHLHLELRKRPGKEIRSGYAGDTLGFTDPTKFIEAHRPESRKP